MNTDKAICNAKIEEVITGPMTYVGSEQCKVCHLEHYDSWKMTLHSRTLQDVTQNRDALITDIDPKVIRASLKKVDKNLKVPVEQIYIPKVEEIKYTIGIQWKQRFLIERKGKLYIAPIQYNAWDNTWSAYHENDWDQHSWDERCGGCHVTGLDLEKNTFTETAVGCEACHGPGSHHVALPKKAVFDKRWTIVNPSKLPAGIRTQICGACQHCVHPACAGVCPVKAITKLPMENVVINEKKCIGCRYCYQACPYKVPRFDFEKRVTRKCHLCYDRIPLLNYMKPACVEACPVEALSFGYKHDIILEAKKRIYREKNRGTFWV